MPRYKKKMSMYSQTHVGYCMMTFVIRNQLPALQMGPQKYMENIRALARRWSMSAQNSDKLMEFAGCWVNWIISRRECQDVEAATYLDFAEPFASDFLNGRCEPWRAGGAFPGIVVVANTTRAFANELALHLNASLYLSTAVKDQFQGV